MHNNLETIRPGWTGLLLSMNQKRRGERHTSSPLALLCRCKRGPSVPKWYAYTSDLDGIFHQSTPRARSQRLARFIHIFIVVDALRCAVVFAQTTTKSTLSIPNHLIHIYNLSMRSAAPAIMALQVFFYSDLPRFVPVVHRPMLLLLLFSTIWWL